MEAAIEYTRKASLLKSINKVRMALNVVWFSDIVTVDGGRLDNMWRQPHQYKIHRNSYQWPKKHHITKFDWRIWRAWMQSINRYQNNDLAHPLGEWNCDRDSWVTEWDSVSTLNDELLYIRSSQGIGWTRHVIQPGHRRRRKTYYIDCLSCREPP
mmetsp:Transcript_10490/g.19592  ORF Transcript_10490/g.19592 Transcript_10490/m.19592 type:complete len:155 (-) Transcript_10490:965-1429(-)